MPIRNNLFDESLDHLKPEFFVGHFPPAEPERDLHLHFFAQEIDGMAQLDAEVVWINRRTELNFFYLSGVLVFFSFLVALGLLVPVFAVIHDSAYGRHSVWSYFDEIHAVASRHVDRIAERNNSELLTVNAYDSNLTGTYLPIDLNERACGGRAARKERAAQDTLFS